MIPNAIKNTTVRAFVEGKRWLNVLSNDAPGTYLLRAAATIAANAVALTTDTTGNYVADVADGSGIDVTGTATHIVLAVTGSSTMKQVTTCTSQALVDTGTVTVPAYIISVADPT